MKTNLPKMTNEEFNALSDEQKRIEIAKDVIAALKAKKLSAGQMVYVNNTNIDDIIRQDGSQQLQPLLIETQKECQVCAKGALFVCDVIRRNEFKVSKSVTSIDSDIILQKLEYFSESQLNLIETAFEGDTKQEEGLVELDEEGDAKYDENFDVIYIPVVKQAIKFSKRFTNDTNRMIAIMKNIIENNGEFKP